MKSRKRWQEKEGDQTQKEEVSKLDQTLGSFLFPSLSAVFT